MGPGGAYRRVLGKPSHPGTLSFATLEAKIIASSSAIAVVAGATKDFVGFARTPRCLLEQIGRFRQALLLVCPTLDDFDTHTPW